MVCVVLHASGTPNPTLAATDQPRCLSFAQAEEQGLNIAELREDYTVAVEAFPDHKADLAEAWSDLQYKLRDRLQENASTDFSGRSMFSIMLFEADGRIAWVFYRGLESEDERVFCETVEKLSVGYRFPLESSTRFSQCGTTHFSEE